MNESGGARGREAREQQRARLAALGLSGRPKGRRCVGPLSVRRLTPGDLARVVFSAALERMTNDAAPIG